MTFSLHLALSSEVSSLSLFSFIVSDSTSRERSRMLLSLAATVALSLDKF